MRDNLSLFTKTDFYIGLVRALLIPTVLFYFLGLKVAFLTYISVRFCIKQIICKRMLN
jgi:hypothetical protein